MWPPEGEVILTTLGQKGRDSYPCLRVVSALETSWCMCHRQTYREEEYTFGAETGIIGRCDEPSSQVRILEGEFLGNTRSHIWQEVWETGLKETLNPTRSGTGHSTLN